VPDREKVAMTDFLEYIRVNPKSLEQTVFRYLKHEDGPNELRGIGHKALIACTSRTGSSLLQVSLERYGLDAQEFFNPEGPPKRAFDSGSAKTIRDYATLLAHTAVSGDWFVAKGALNSILYLYYFGEVPEFGSEWKFVFLRRQNVVRQAISMEIATATKQWTAKMPSQREIRLEDYSFDKLHKSVESIFAQNDRWERAFGYLGIEPYRLFYEDLTADVAGQTESVAKFLRIDVEKFPAASSYTPWIEQQSTELNVEWENRFRRELAAGIAKRQIPQI
jgi:LPS sulfotransferase NodH